MDKYHFKGLVYHNYNRLGEKEMYTMANSFEQAEKNFRYRAANGDPHFWEYHIMKHDIEKVKPNKNIEKDYELEPKKEIEHCDRCGYELNDAGECPICDLGEEELWHEMNKLDD